MFQLFKRDLIVNRAFFIFILLFPIVIYMINLPSPDVYTYAIIFMLLIVQTFHMEKANHANRVWISLPVKRNHFVLSRYLFLFIMSIFILLYISLISYLFNKNVSGVMFLLSFIIIITVLALSIPIYYAFRSVWKSVIIHYLFLIVGSFIFGFIFADPYDLFEPFILFFLNMIDFQPIVVIPLFLIVLTYLSYELSCYLFRTKDL